MISWPLNLHFVFASTVGTPRIIATARTFMNLLERTELPQGTRYYRYVHRKWNLAVKVFYTCGRKSGGGSRNGQ
jgi:hypothetical protein